VKLRNYLVIFLFFLTAISINVQGLTITCDKDIYYGLARIEAYCNVTNSGNVNINFTASFPNIIYGLEGIYDLQNVTYSKTVLDHFEYREGANHTGEVFLYNSTHLIYTTNSTSVFVPLSFVWNYFEGTDGWWTENVSVPIYTSVLDWKYDWIPLSYVTYQVDSIKKYGIEGYYLINSNGNFKIVFNVPPNSKGKFNLTVSADGSGFVLDPWFNSSWQFRRPLNVSEPSGVNRINYIFSHNLTIPAGHISNCTKEIRVTQLDTEQSLVGNEIEVPSFVADGDDNTYCLVLFSGNVSSKSWRIFNIYYGNPNAQVPNYDFSSSSYFINLFNFSFPVISTVPINLTHFLLIGENVLYVANSTHILNSVSISNSEWWHTAIYSLNETDYFLVTSGGENNRIVNYLKVNPDLSVSIIPIQATFNAQRGWGAYLKDDILGITEDWTGVLRIYNSNSVIVSFSTTNPIHSYGVILFNSTTPFMRYITHLINSCIGYPCDVVPTFGYEVFNGTDLLKFVHPTILESTPPGFGSYYFSAIDPISFNEVWAGGSGGRLFIINDKGNYISVPTMNLGVMCERTDEELSTFDYFNYWCRINSIKHYGNALELIWHYTNFFDFSFSFTSVILWNKKTNQVVNFNPLADISKIYPVSDFINNRWTDRYSLGFKPMESYSDGTTWYSVVRTQEINQLQEESLAPPAPAPPAPPAVVSITGALSSTGLFGSLVGVVTVVILFLVFLYTRLTEIRVEELNIRGFLKFIISFVSLVIVLSLVLSAL